MSDRYDTASNPEGRFQPGSAGAVLLNKPSITDLAEMDRLELSLLQQLASLLVEEIAAGQALTVSDLRDWHYRWLDGHKADYFLAIQAGLDNDQPMRAMIAQVLRDSGMAPG